jgi:hypothetical protein
MKTADVVLVARQGWFQLISELRWDAIDGTLETVSELQLLIFWILNFLEAEAAIGSTREEA